MGCSRQPNGEVTAPPAGASTRAETRIGEKAQEEGASFPAASPRPNQPPAPLSPSAGAEGPEEAAAPSPGASGDGG